MIMLDNNTAIYKTNVKYTVDDEKPPILHNLTIFFYFCF